MAYREFDGRTEAEAVELACIELGIPKKSLRYDVLSHGSTGVFGIIKARKASIRVKIDDDPPARPKPSADAVNMDEPSGTVEIVSSKKPEPASQPKAGKGKKSRSQKSAKDRAEKPTQTPWPEKTSALKAADSTAPEEKSGTPEKSRSTRAGRRKKKEAALKSKAGETGDKQNSPASGKDETSEGIADIHPDPSIAEETQGPIDPAVIEQAIAHAHEIMVRLSDVLMDSPSVSASHISGPELLIRVDGSDAANLIGRKGQTLDAVQHIIESILNKDRKPKLKIRVDAGDYLAKREENLIKLALRLAEKVKKSGRVASFSPMPANERRIIHLALKEDPLIRTQSKGSGELRKLIIMTRKSPEIKSDTE
ncbi:MAG: RNA-binding cell elongation regulator Jag/EloR [Thermodesulfobacteriota bacterium]